MERDLTTLRYQAASTGTGTLAVTIEELNAVQRALDAEREKVKELVANQAEYEKCTDEQITALNQGCLDYEKQIATLQAQLRQVEGDAETYRKMHAVCTMNLALANNDLTTLRQLVEALPVVDGRMDVE